MSSSLLDAAFAHHVWATLRVLDACLARSAEELKTSVLGTRGPISKPFATSSPGIPKTCTS